MESAGQLSVNFTLDAFDYAVIIAYLAAIVPLGMWFGRFTRSTQDFFLGGQRFSERVQGRMNRGGSRWGSGSSRLGK